MTGGSILNYGLGTAGMSLEPSRAYDGFLYVRSGDNSTARFNVSFVSVAADGAPQKTLASHGFTVLPSGGWKRVDFTLQLGAQGTTCSNTSSPRTACRGNPEHSCIQCDGAFQISVQEGSIIVDHVFLQPGEWGRYQGLPVRRDIAEGLFQTMGFTVLRLGGSMCNAEGYRWKEFRGPPERRNPYRGTWYDYASGSWRIFEFLALIEAAKVHGVVTINNNEEADDMADFVEYCYGDNTTNWGRQRIRDGHAAPYPPFVVEIGNEQSMSSTFVAQVSAISEAMNARAKALGLQFPLQFAIGHNFAIKPDLSPAPPGHPGLNLTNAMISAVKPLGSNVFWDCHVSADDPASAPDAAAELLQAMRSHFTTMGSAMKVGVLEENGSKHSLARALSHARMNHRDSTLGSFFTVETPANCLQGLGRNDNSWDQGQLFYDPAQVWLAPTGYVQQMIARAWQPNVLPIRSEGNKWQQTLDVLAAVDDDASSLVLRLVNFGEGGLHAPSEEAEVSFHLEGCDAMNGTAVAVSEMWSHDPNAVNPPPPLPAGAKPQSGAPTMVHRDGGGNTAVVRYTLKPNSFTTLAIQCGASAAKTRN